MLPRAMRVDHGGKKGWACHRNGGYPFFVEYDPAGSLTSAVLWVECDEADAELSLALAADSPGLLYTYKVCHRLDDVVEWVHPSTCMPKNAVADGHGEECDDDNVGFCVLIKLKAATKDVYIAVGNAAIQELTLADGEKLLHDEIVSTCTDDDIWYPVLRTSVASYLLVEEQPVRLTHEQHAALLREHPIGEPVDDVRGEDPYMVQFMAPGDGFEPVGKVLCGCAP